MFIQIRLGPPLPPLVVTKGEVGEPSPFAYNRAYRFESVSQLLVESVSY